MDITLRSISSSSSSELPSSSTHSPSSVSPFNFITLRPHTFASMRLSDFDLFGGAVDNQVVVGIVFDFCFLQGMGCPFLSLMTMGALFVLAVYFFMEERVTHI